MTDFNNTKNTTDSTDNQVTMEEVLNAKEKLNGLKSLSKCSGAHCTNNEHDMRLESIRAKMFIDNIDSYDYLAEIANRGM